MAVGVAVCGRKQLEIATKTRKQTKKRTAWRCVADIQVPPASTSFGPSLKYCPKYGGVEISGRFLLLLFRDLQAQCLELLLEKTGQREVEELEEDEEEEERGPQASQGLSESACCFVFVWVFFVCACACLLERSPVYRFRV